MKIISLRYWHIGALFVSNLGCAVDIRGAPDSWTNTAATGLWQDATKWSLGVAPTSTHTATFITNVNTKTVTINSATPAGNLTISNLTLRGLGGSTNTLQITNAPGSTLLIRNELIVGTNAVLRLTNANL
jgi:hypothetical protein